MSVDGKGLAIDKKQVESVADDLLQNVFRYFGFKWAHFAALIGIVSAGFGLDAYVNPASWTAAALVAFIFVFSIRHYVTSDYLRYVLLSAACYIVAVVALVVVLTGGYFGLDLKTIKAGAAEYRFGISFLGSLILSFNIALLIVAYRKHDFERASELPEEFKEKLQRDMIDAPLYRKNLTYTLTPTPTPKEARTNGRDNITFRIFLDYEIVNRFAREVDHEISFTSPNRTLQLQAIKIGGKTVPHDEPSFITPVGLRLPVKIPTNGVVAVHIETLETFRIPDQEVFGTHLPCIGLKVIIENFQSHDLNYRFESFLLDRLDPVTEGKKKVWSTDKALLPYQGVRLHWMAKTG